MVNPFFGERWDAPIVENAPQVPTPVGEECGWCQVRIAAGDRGIITGYVKADNTVCGLPYHRECMFASTCGHQFGVCSCCPGEYDMDTPQGRRQAALALWRAICPGI